MERVGRKRRPDPRRALVALGAALLRASERMAATLAQAIVGSITPEVGS